MKHSHRARTVVLLLFVLIAAPSGAGPRPVTQYSEPSSPAIPLNTWKARLGRIPDAEKMKFDDSLWTSASLIHRWDGTETDCWFRRAVTIPRSLKGRPVYLEMTVDSKGELFIDGGSHGRFSGHTKKLLTPSGTPGAVYTLSLHGISDTVFGMFISAFLTGGDPALHELRCKTARAEALVSRCTLPVYSQWRFTFTDNPGFAAETTSPGPWHSVWLKHIWKRDDTAAWYRKDIVVPAVMHGFTTEGSAVALDFTVDDDCEVYVNGERRGHFRDFGTVVLSTHARPGETCAVAIRVINRGGPGGLYHAQLRLSGVHDRVRRVIKLIKESMSLYGRTRGSTPARAAVVRCLPVADRLIAAGSLPSVALLSREIETVSADLSAVEELFAKFPLFTAGPYLQNPAHGSVTIKWETNLPADSRITYGETQQCGKSVSQKKPETMHGIRLKNLRHGRKYYYRIESGNSRSPLYRFTAPPAHTGAFSFFVCGDTHAYFTSVQEQIMERIASRDPDFGIFVGDVTNYGKMEEWAPYHFYPARKVLRSMPTFIAPGNHEYYSATPENRVPSFEHYIDQPNNNYWFSFQYGNSRFIVLDPNKGDPVGITPESPQYQWLRKELESREYRNSKWRFVFLHEPPFSEGWAHRYYDGEDTLRKHLVPLFEKHRVTMVFSGHTHDYEFGQWPRGKGPCYVVTGGGGAQLDDTRYREWDQIQKVRFIHHFCTVHVSGRTLTFRAIDTRGRVFDSFIITAEK